MLIDQVVELCYENCLDYVHVRSTYVHVGEKSLAADFVYFQRYWLISLEFLFNADLTICLLMFSRSKCGARRNRCLTTRSPHITSNSASVTSAETLKVRRAQGVSNLSPILT